ncbi:MAG: hypothetical protein U5L45_00270 [Saprospiraceae bacterium]|nr:hypothetical protein [Saprospiraceae bacterium]
MNKFTACPTDCSPLVLPILDVNQDCFSAESVYTSQITDIILMSKTNGLGVANTFPTAHTAAAWATVIDNTDVTGSKAKRIRVVGTMPAPEVTTVTLPKFKTITKYRTYTLTGAIQQFTQNNFEFLKNLMCGGFAGYVWFCTEDFIFGGLSAQMAIEVKTVDANIVFDGGDENSYMTGNIVVTFRTTTFPPSASNLMF